MCIKTPRRRSPRLRDSVQHALRKCICYWQAPSSGQTWRLWIWVPYHSLCWREEVSLHWDSPQGATSISTSSGNHGWLGHFGATDITYYFSSLILQSTWGRSLTGGKAYLHTFGQLWASASTPRGECEWIKQRAVSVLNPAEYTPYFFKINLDRVGRRDTVSRACSVSEIRDWVKCRQMHFIHSFIPWCSFKFISSLSHSYGILFIFEKIYIYIYIYLAPLVIFTWFNPLKNVYRLAQWRKIIFLTRITPVNLMVTIFR